MPLEIPSRDEVTSGLQAYVRTYLPELDPTITRRRGYIGGKIRSLASALHDWYVKLKRYADREPFPQKASENFLIGGWWTDITGLTRLPSAAASGIAVVTGTDGTIIPAGTTMTGTGGLDYETDASSTIIQQSIIISSLTRSGSTAIAETPYDHLLASGMEVVIAGATQTDYNGTVTIAVTAANEFTFELTASPTTPATGSPTVSAAWANPTITCTTKGADTNVDAGSTMTISSPPSGADSTALVTFGTIGGGSDLEDIEDYRERLLEALAVDFGMFSAAEIKIVAKEVPGVTRVWVAEATENATNGVLPGQVKIFFMRDRDANPFPSGSEVSDVLDAILAIKPAHMVTEDVTVEAPTRLDIDFDFAGISPDTASMRLAIRAKLQQFFDESVDLGTNITEDDYRCAIKETYDTERNAPLASFTLTSPSGDITVALDELPFLGDVTF